MSVRDSCTHSSSSVCETADTTGPTKCRRHRKPSATRWTSRRASYARRRRVHDRTSRVPDVARTGRGPVGDPGPWMAGSLQRGGLSPGHFATPLPGPIDLVARAVEASRTVGERAAKHPCRTRAAASPSKSGPNAASSCNASARPSWIPSRPPRAMAWRMHERSTRVFGPLRPIRSVGRSLMHRCNQRPRGTV
jgi:hypothetical protein